MKICYFDESGTGEEPVAVVTGVIVGTQRMHVTKEHWSDCWTRSLTYAVESSKSFKQETSTGELVLSEKWPGLTAPSTSPLGVSLVLVGGIVTLVTFLLLVRKRHRSANTE